MPANVAKLITQESGAYILINSGIGTLVSGQTVNIKSGVMVQVASGQQATTSPRLGTKISGNYVGIEAAATQLPTVAGFNFVLKSVTGNADIFIAGAGVNSGAGLILDGGNAVSDLQIDNLDTVYAWAVTSGQYLSWLGVTY